MSLRMFLASGSFTLDPKTVATIFGLTLPELGMLGITEFRFGDIVRSAEFQREFLLVAGHEAGGVVEAVDADGVRWHLLVEDITVVS